MVKNLFFALVVLLATLPVTAQSTRDADIYCSPVVVESHQVGESFMEWVRISDLKKCMGQNNEKAIATKLFDIRVTGKGDIWIDDQAGRIFDWRFANGQLAEVIVTEKAKQKNTEVANGRAHQTKIAGHVFGETFEQWMSETGANIDEICAKNASKAMHKMCKEVSTFSGNGVVSTRGATWSMNDEGYSSGKIGDLDREMEILKRRLNGGDVVRKFRWTFRNGKLSEAFVEIPGPDLDAEFGRLEQTYGVPTKVDTSTFTNAMGGKWDCREEHWVMPDGAIINAMDRVIMGSQIGVFHDLTIYFKSKEAVTNMVDEYKDKNKTNPY